MTKTASPIEPGTAPVASNSGISVASNGPGGSGPFKRPLVVSPRGGGIKKRLGVPGPGGPTPRQHFNPQQHQRGHPYYGRGRAAFQQNQNRFRFVKTVNGNKNGKTSFGNVGDLEVFICLYA